MTTIREQIGQQLKSQRDALGLSQMDVERLSGVDQSIISRLETGDQNATLDTFIAVYSSLGLRLIFAIDKDDDLC